MKVFITGATGLIGQLLAKRLLERGDEVTVLSRNREKAKKLFVDRVEVVEGNPSEAGEWQKAVERADAVVNLAGEPVAEKRWNSEEKKRIYDSRILSTRLVAEAIKNAAKKPEVLVNASAVGYYGFQQDDRELDEHETPGRDFLAKLCSDWEFEARKAEQAGIRVVRMRIGIVLSDRGGTLEKMAGIFKMYAGGPVGSGKQWFPWIHIDDMVGLILFALDNKQVSGPLNCAAPTPVMMKDFTGMMSRVLCRPAVVPTPAIALKAVFGEVSEVLTGGQRVIPKKALELGYSFEYPEAGPALKNLLEL